MHFHEGSAGMARSLVSFLGDRCGHWRPYGAAGRGRQLLDLCVQPPDDPLHSFAALDQIRKKINVSPSKVLIKATVRPLTAQRFYGSLVFFLSKRL